MFELGTAADMTPDEVEEEALNPSEAEPIDPDPKDDENSEPEPAGGAENKPLDGADTVESENKFEEVVGAATTPDWVGGLE